MSLFFAMVFIAELIIAGALIALILNADRKVLALNAQIVTFNPVLEDGFEKFRFALHNIHAAVDSLVCILKRKRKNYIFGLLKTVILTAVTLFAKGKYKKIATALNVVSLIF